MYTEKLVWTEKDFDLMRWHDSKFYAMAFGMEEHEIRFDIDYILEWINPKQGETHFKFIVLPATLIFRNVYDLNINFALLDVTVQDIYRDNPTQPRNAAFIKEQIEYDWNIDTNNGEITFKSVGYTQYARRKPLLSNSQSIDLLERGGISFDTLLQ
jgi:hypothetical protein